MLALQSKIKSIKFQNRDKISSSLPEYEKHAKHICTYLFGPEIGNDDEAIATAVYAIVEADANWNEHGGANPNSYRMSRVYSALRNYVKKRAFSRWFFISIETMARPNLLPPAKTKSPDVNCIDTESYTAYSEFFDNLSSYHQKILEMRNRGDSLLAISSEFGVTKQAIHQALARIKESFYDYSQAV